MKKRRVLVLMHEELVPPASLEGLPEEEIGKWKMEFDVLAALRALGHEVLPIGVADELAPIRKAIAEFKPHICFNLLLHFHDAGVYDSAVVSWLEPNSSSVASLARPWRPPRLCRPPCCRLSFSCN